VRVKKCTPSFFSKVLLVNSLQSGKAWQECAQQTEKSHYHTASAVSRQVYVHALLFQHLYSVFFQYMVWYVPTSELVWMQRRQKNRLKSAGFTELKKITSRSYSKCSNYSSLFSSRSNFVAIPFVSLKNNLQLNVQACCLFYFLVLVHFSKEK